MLPLLIACPSTSTSVSVGSGPRSATVVGSNGLPPSGWVSVVETSLSSMSLTRVYPMSAYACELTLTVGADDVETVC